MTTAASAPCAKSKRRRLSKTVSPTQKWRSYGQGAEGYDALCEEAPKPLAWLADADERNDYSLRGPAAASYWNDAKGA